MISTRGEKAERFKGNEASWNVSPRRETLTGSNSASIRCLVILFITIDPAGEIEFSGWGWEKKGSTRYQGDGEGGEKNERWTGERRADERGSVSNCVPRERKVEENLREEVERERGGKRPGGWTRTRILWESSIEKRDEKQETNRTRSRNLPYLAANETEPLIPSTPGFQLAILVISWLAESNSIQTFVSTFFARRRVDLSRRELYILDYIECTSNVYWKIRDDVSRIFSTHTTENWDLLFSLFTFFPYKKCIPFPFENEICRAHFPKISSIPQTLELQSTWSAKLM